MSPAVPVREIPRARGVITEEQRQRWSAKLRTAFALHESGVALKLAQLRRRDGGASESELARRLGDWLRTRPGAEYGDSAGVPRVRVERAP